MMSLKIDVASFGIVIICKVYFYMLGSKKLMFF